MGAWRWWPLPFQIFAPFASIRSSYSYSVLVSLIWMYFFSFLASSCLAVNCCQKNLSFGAFYWGNWITPNQTQHPSINSHIVQKSSKLTRAPPLFCITTCICIGIALAHLVSRGPVTFIEQESLPGALCLVTTWVLWYVTEGEWGHHPRRLAISSQLDVLD